MTMTKAIRVLAASCALLLLATPARAQANERLCDPSWEDCRAPLLNLIRNETQGIDVAFWFMEDSRYSTALIERWRAGVPVRVIMDTEANASYPGNVPILNALKNAGIPMLEKTTGGIVHWKMMLFHGQNTVEFSGANFSPDGFVPIEPYVNFIDEVIYFTDDPAIVNSFRTKYDDHWTATSGFKAYANIVEPRTRHYATFPIDPEMNFPPGQDFANRSVGRYNAEKVAIDAIMFRITDRRHTDALIAAVQRGVPVRLITAPEEYRDPTRPWDSWNKDRLYMGGVQMRFRKHEGHMHQKTTLLRGQLMAIHGSSNWTSPSANSQLEHNIFTKKPWFYQYMSDLFERKWTNATGHVETEPFVPLPPDPPVLQSPANAAQNQATTLTLKWSGGLWAHKYDVYLGTDPNNMTLIMADQELGPSDKGQSQSFAVSGLALSTTYYWRVVGRTMANLSRNSPIWSFRTQGTPPAAGPLDAVLYAAKAPVVVGRWSPVADTTAAGGARMANPNLGAASVPGGSTANPVDYFEMTFNADAGVPYRLWVRGKATSNSWVNDSAWFQFNDSVDVNGKPLYQIGTTSAANVTIEDCSNCGLSNWGWNDNAVGAGVLGPQIYFANSGPHTIRVQVREDGLSIDQIVLSRDVYLSSSPGLPKDDGTILVESPGGTNGNPPPPPPQAHEVVLHMTNALLAGAWQLVSDATAASGVATVLPNAGRAKVTTPLAAPADYFELTFDARANTPYRLWLRGKATADNKDNDSVHVQFSNAVTASGAAMARIGSTTSVEVNLEDCSGCGNSGWGWEDNGWGTPTTLGPEIRFAADGVQTIRIQNREDGFQIDQIVLSPKNYLTAAPGANKDDHTILPPTP